MKKVLFILAPENFRDIEYIVPRAFFEQNNIQVETASSTKVSVGRFSFGVENDFLLDDIPHENFDGIFFVGGNGSLDYLQNHDAINLAETFVENDKVVGAICAAPRLLIQWGIMQGRECTGWNGDDQVPILCEKHGATFVNDEVVIDGKLITGKDALASELFAIEFIKLLNQ